MEKKPAKSADIGAQDRLKIYAGIVIVLIILAAVSLLWPKGSALSQCNGILIQQNKYSCIAQLALSSDNATYCGYLPSQNANQCYSQIAEKGNNAEICTRINGTASMASCVGLIANATSDAHDCSYLAGAPASSCYTSLAVKTLNGSVCSEIGQVANQQACSASVSISEALASKSSTPCAGVVTDNSTGFNNMTIANVTAIAKSPKLLTGLVQVSEYEHYTNSSRYSTRDACYLVLAESDSNSTYCSGITNGYLAYYCSSQSVSVGTSSGATPVNYTALLQSCSVEQQYAKACDNAVYISEAVADKNTTDCTLVSNSTGTYSCYLALAIAYKQPAYCGYIKNASANSACEMDISYNASGSG